MTGALRWPVRRSQISSNRGLNAAHVDSEEMKALLSAITSLTGHDMAIEAHKSVPGGQESNRRKPVDWDAVARDYRLGQFTLREMAHKHGCSHQAIAKRAKEHGWTQDLGEQIRQATNAKLVAKLVNQRVASGGQEIANVVLAAAEIKAAVVMRHRSRLEVLARDADAARAKLLQMMESVADVKEAGALVSAVESAVRTEKILIEQERKSHQLDNDTAAEDATRKVKRVTLDFEDAEVKHG